MGQEQKLKLPQFREREIGLGEASPKERRVHIQEWLDFANLLLDHPEKSLEILQQEFVKHFVGSQGYWGILAFDVRRNRRTTELSRLYKTIRGILDRIPEFQWTDGPSFRFEVPYYADPGAEDNTRFHFALDPPIESLLTALEGMEIRRFKRCLCGRLFYALRAAKDGAEIDAGSKACSKRCNEKRRKRSLRMNSSERYQQNRKLNERARELKKSGEWLRGN